MRLNYHQIANIVGSLPNSHKMVLGIREGQRYREDVFVVLWAFMNLPLSAIPKNWRKNYMPAIWCRKSATTTEVASLMYWARGASKSTNYLTCVPALLGTKSRIFQHTSTRGYQMRKQVGQQCAALKDTSRKYSSSGMRNRITYASWN